jgi:hypothetical protein
VTVRFAATNEFGVLDHRVTLPGGEPVDNPMRVLAEWFRRLRGRVSRSATDRG